MRAIPWRRASWFISWFLALTVSPAWGQLPQPFLSTIFPPGGKAGTDGEVAVAGVDLDDAQQLLFSHPGIKAHVKNSDPAIEPPKPGAVKVRFQVTIDGDVPPGVYEVRLVGRFGVTNPRAFVVSNANEVLDADGNISVEKASELVLGSTVNGRTHAGECKYYKIPLKANERVLITCQGTVLDSRMSPAVSLLGPAREELAWARAAEGEDAVLEFTAPCDGTYVVRLNDTVYGGGSEHAFRLSAQSTPRVEFIFPPAGVPGSSGTYTIYGYNLPNGVPADEAGGGLLRLQKAHVNIAIPADDGRQFVSNTRPTIRHASVASIEYRLTSPAGLSNPLPLYIASAPVVIEKEPNGGSKPQHVTVPCEIAGRFDGPSDEDWYQFSAQKGEVLSLDVMSHRMALTTDPHMGVFRVAKDGTGAETLADVAQVDDLAERTTTPVNGFDASSDDPRYKLTVPEDGVFRVMLRNQVGTRRPSIEQAYRLSIRPPHPDFSLVAETKRQASGSDPKSAGPATPRVRNGGTVAIDVHVLRSEDFSGDVTIGVEGLPQGLTAYPVIARTEDRSVPLILSADDSMASWCGPLNIVGKARLDGREVRREAREAGMLWNTADRQVQPPVFRLSQSMHVAVIGEDAEVFVVQVEDKTWEASIGGSLELPVRIVRRGDFKGPVKLTAVGLPAEMKPKEITADERTDEVTLKIPLSNPKIKPRVYTFYVNGDAQRMFERNPEALSAAEAVLSEATAKVTKLMEAKQAAPADKELDDELKKATQTKVQAEAKVVRAKQANDPKRITVTLASPPVKMRVADRPFTIAVAGPVTVRAGQKAELPITLTRSCGYAERIELTFESSGVDGLRAASVSLAKDQAGATIVIAPGVTTPPGDYKGVVKAKGDFNGSVAEATATVTVKVLPAS